MFDIRCILKNEEFPVIFQDDGRFQYEKSEEQERLRESVARLDQHRLGCWPEI